LSSIFDSPTSFDGQRAFVIDRLMPLSCGGAVAWRSYQVRVTGGE